MKLPVIQTCGECKHCHTTGVCMHQRAHPVYEIDGCDHPPPSWCPLRTGPDEAELDALRARVRELEAERDRIHKMFDDAGQGEHNVLALVDYYVHELEAERAELEALRAVAEAARAEHDARCAWSAYCAGGPIAQINAVHEAIDATTAALRRLDEVRRG